MMLSAAARPTAGWSRSSSCATTRGSSASQFHPEFKSRPERPHPLFDGFVAAALAVRDGREPVFAARPIDGEDTPATATDAIESVPSA